jgi:aryl-alcohol dehydrogenase-like predicted oxidoreductase
VPDLEVLPHISKSYVETVIDTSLRRLGMERLDLVQFHWWNYGVPRWLETAHWLEQLRRAGKIDKIGGTNFDTRRMTEMIDSGAPLASMQVQYSLLDRRPAKSMVQAAIQRGVALFCYGTVAGGFLSEKWLGAPEPKGAMENRSLTKYRLIIEEFGGWDLFQTLLRTLYAIARRHRTDIATVASVAVLEWPAVAAVIVGARNRAHLPANLAISDLSLTKDDRAEIDGVLVEGKELEGDVFALERDTKGRHGSIMKYNLNKGAA